MKTRSNYLGVLFVLIIPAIFMGIMMLFSTDAEADSPLRQQDEVISTVNGVDITVGEYQDRLQAERWYQAQEIRELFELSVDVDTFEGGQNPFQQQINILLGELLNTEGFGEHVLEDMELQILLEQEAEQRGIVIDKDAIFAQIDDYTARMTGQSLTPIPTLRPSPTRPPTSTFLPPPTATTIPAPTIGMTIDPSPTALPTSTPLAPFEVEGTIVAFQADLFAMAQMFDISTEAVTEVFYFQALQVAMREARFDELVESGEIRTQSLTATTRHILIAVPGSENRSYENFDQTLCVSDEWESYRQTAEDVLSRLADGEAFEDLAAELTDDVGTASNGGFLGEVNDVDRVYIPEFAAAVHKAEIGDYYGPVCSVFGFHILQVLDKYWRDIPEIQVRADMNNYYFEWTTELLLDATIERGDNWPQWIIGEPTLEAMLGDLYEFDGNELRP